VIDKTTYISTRVAHGGLMRCCLGSLATFCANHADEKAIPGTIVTCTYGHPCNMLLGVNLVWSWAPEPPAKRRNEVTSDLLSAEA
jgi:hypothetical protein